MSETNQHESSAIDAFIRRANEQSTVAESERPWETPDASCADSKVDDMLARFKHMKADFANIIEIVTLTSADVRDETVFCNKLAEDLDSYDRAIDALTDIIDAGWQPLTTAAFTNDQTESEPAIDQAANTDDLQGQIELQSEMIRNLESKLEHLTNNSEDQNGSRLPLTDVKRHSYAPPYLNRLIIATNTDGNLKFPINQSIITIGRESLNDIHIRSRFISRFHARIVSDGDGAIIEDLDSRNGLTVNSKKVHRQKLRSGDLIDLGKTQLRYIDLTEGSTGEGSA